MNSTRISPKDWRAAGQLFHYKGNAIYYRVGGLPNSRPLLLIHGFPTASWDWEAMWPDLVKHYRVLVLDLIGFGFSAKPPSYEYSLVDQADLVEAFLNEQGVDRYDLMAHDYGVSIAQELLARQTEAGLHPQMTSLALLNGGLFPETHRPVLVQKLLLSPVGPLISKLMSRNKFASNMRKVFGAKRPPDDMLIDSFWELMQHNEGQRVMHKLIKYIPERKANRERWVGALQNSRIPVKLINGLDDPISGRHMVERYIELVPRPNVTGIEGIGHYPQCEDPDAVLNAYLEFRNGMDNSK